MSGASVAYHLRPNKHVERHLFVDLLDHVNRWTPLAKYLYVGFGGIYFEDFKLLHSHFNMVKMVSIEKEKWVYERQRFNIPYGCIEPKHWDSSVFVGDLDKLRAKYKVDNILCWLDYPTSVELANQLSEIRGLIPKLLHGDILKITLPANPTALAAKRADESEAQLQERRLEELRNRLGTQFLPEGVTSDQMTERHYPDVLAGAFRRVVSEAMQEDDKSIFQPLGSYIYKDVTQIITFTAIMLHSDDVQNFFAKTEIEKFDLGGPEWQLLKIEVPDLSLREKLKLDQVIFAKTGKQRPTTVQARMGLKFAEQVGDSRRMVENYIKFYRYYPHYYRVTF